MKITYIILLMVIGTTALLPQTLTLEQSVELGLRNSRELRISESSLKSAESKITEFTSQMLPKLSLSAGYNYLNLDDPNQLGLGPIPIQVKNPFYLYGMQLSIQQPIFTGFQLSSLRSSAINSSEAVSYEHQKNINNKALEIHNSFWILFKAQKSVELTEEYLLSLEEDLRKTKNFVDNGLVSNNDLLRLQLKLSNAKLQLIDAKNNLSLAKANFNKSLGLPLTDSTNIETNFPVIVEQSYNYNEFLTEAMANRKELKSSQFKVKSSEDRITAANSNWWPKLYAGGNFYLYNVNAETFSISNEKLQLWSVGLTLNWDLWDWGYTSSKSEQAEQELLQNKETLELLREQIEIEVYNAYLMLKSQVEKINVSKLAVESAEENFRIVNDKYEYQLATTNDLIDAEAELVDAKSKLSISQADYELAKAKLNLAIGRKIY